MNQEKINISLISWNCLAQKWLNGRLHSEFAHVMDTVSVLKCGTWSFRLQKIKNILLEHDVDIICLQEIEYEHFEADFADLLVKYDYIKQTFKKINKNHNMGNITLFKRDKFTLIWHKSRTRTLLVDLYKQDCGKIINITNVHLQAGASKEHIRMNQLKNMLHDLDERSYGYVVICGDFNSTYNDDSNTIINCLENNNADFKYNYKFHNLEKDINDSTYFSSSGINEKFDYIFHTNLDISRIGRNNTLINSSTKSPSNIWPSDHDLIGCK